jgi:hypothetical protein
MLQFSGKLSLLLDGLQDGGTSFLELAQVSQTTLEQTQLGVGEPARRFLAVASDEGHGGALVQQPDRGLHLMLVTRHLLGEPLGDSLHVSHVPVVEDDLRSCPMTGARSMVRSIGVA